MFTHIGLEWHTTETGFTFVHVQLAVEKDVQVFQLMTTYKGLVPMILVLASEYCSQKQDTRFQKG